MSEPTPLNQKVAHFVEVTVAEKDRANAELAAHGAYRDTVRKEAAATVDKLIQHNLLDPTAKEAAIEKLCDPAYSFEQLRKLALSQRAPGDRTDAPTLGTPVPQPGEGKTAASRQPEGPHQRDLDFVNALGLSPNYA